MEQELIDENVTALVDTMTDTDGLTSADTVRPEGGTLPVGMWCPIQAEAVERLMASPVGPYRLVGRPSGATGRLSATRLCRDHVYRHPTRQRIGNGTPETAWTQ